MKYDKINFLHIVPTSLSSSYIYYQGLKSALERNGLLYYEYGVGGKDKIDMGKLLEYPILCVNGSWEPVFSIVKRVAGRQFVADINSEPLVRADSYQGIKKFIGPKISRIGRYLKVFSTAPKERFRQALDDLMVLLQVNVLKNRFYSRQLTEKRSKYFDMYFSGTDGDMGDYFGKPCYFFISWAHTELLDDIVKPTSDKILFVGAPHSSRLAFLKNDEDNIVEARRTQMKNDPQDNVRELCKLINAYKYTLCPMGFNEVYIPGKIFEYLACKRLCFCYSSGRDDVAVGRMFKDKEDVVYFRDFAELKEKYEYYRNNPQEAQRIAQSGYEKVRKYHNADVRATRFAGLLLRHANGGEYDGSQNDVFQLKKV